MAGQRWHPSVCTASFQYPRQAQRQFHRDDLRLPVPSVHPRTCRPHSANQVHCTWRSVISCGSITLRTATDQLPRSHGSTPMAWDAYCGFLRTPRGSLELPKGFAGADGSWGTTLRGCVELVCSLQESRNESHTREMSWELTGNLLAGNLT